MSFRLTCLTFLVQLEFKTRHRHRPVNNDADQSFTFFRWMSPAVLNPSVSPCPTENNLIGGHIQVKSWCIHLAYTHTQPAAYHSAVGLERHLPIGKTTGNSLTKLNDTAKSRGKSDSLVSLHSLSLCSSPCLSSLTSGINVETNKMKCQLEQEIFSFSFSLSALLLLSALLSVSMAGDIFHKKKHWSLTFDSIGRK